MKKEQKSVYETLWDSLVVCVWMACACDLALTFAAQGYDWPKAIIFSVLVVVAAQIVFVVALFVVGAIFVGVQHLLGWDK